MWDMPIPIRLTLYHKQYLQGERKNIQRNAKNEELFRYFLEYSHIGTDLG